MKNIIKQRGQILIILFGSMFFGGAASVTTFVEGSSTKDVKKAIKKVVADDARQDEIVSLIKQWDKKHKKTRKQVEKDQKALLEVLTSYDATRQAMQQAAVILNESIDSEDKVFLDLKYSMREKMTKEEWDQFWVQKDK
jgi:uncharacterized protein YlxW (UPF0749 family)